MIAFKSEWEDFTMMSAEFSGASVRDFIKNQNQGNNKRKEKPAGGLVLVRAEF